MEVKFIDIKDFRDTMLEQRKNGMDFLREVVGMDWGEEGLGAIYILENSETHENIELAVRTTDRKNPELPSVSEFTLFSARVTKILSEFFP